MLNNMTKLVLLTTTSVLAMAVLPSIGFTAPASAAGEIVIEGASAEFDKTNNTITYTGNVEAKMDSVAINGEVLLVNLAQDRVQRITTSGTPARFSQAASPSTGRPDETTASADTVVYYPEENKLELTGEAQLIQGSNVVSSPSIRYDILGGEVGAGDNTGTERVQMQLLLPQVDVNAKPPADAIER